MSRNENNWTLTDHAQKLLQYCPSEMCIIHVIVTQCIHRYTVKQMYSYMYCIVSYHIVLLYRIVSYRIVMYRIVMYRIVSYRIVSYRIVSYRIVSYRIVSYRIVSYRIVSNRIVSYRITSPLNQHHVVNKCIRAPKCTSYDMLIFRACGFN